MSFYLRDKIFGKLGVSQHQLQILLLHNAVQNEGISLSDCDQGGNQITNPRRVDEVKMVQPTQLIVVVK